MEFISDGRIAEHTVALLEDLDELPLAVIAGSGDAKAVVGGIVPESGPIAQFTTAGFNSFIPPPR